ncbi:MAG TPA: metallophosphoesterase [Candidatus Polarisedimenticolia bacterium]|jgi:UDP-2,3-diacylglucosamine pyrophosphatase LpxH|nr:metallophosphoesterase [Candidatus Polarisedimenticolia bacterium]
MYRNPVIVQISDLHFGRNTKPWRWRNPSINKDAQATLRQAIVEIDPRPDFLIVTGDIANRGRVDEMNEGRTFLESVLNALWADGHATRCILIPGNHDVWRTTCASLSGYRFRSQRLTEWNQVFPGWSFLAPTLPESAGEYHRPFSLFEHYKARGGEGGKPLAPPAAQAKADEALRFCEYFPTFNLGFLKLDSNTKEGRWPGHIARGLVGIHQRQTMDSILHTYDEATRELTSPFAEARRIGLVHHHVTRLPNVKLEHWMLMDDAGEVARWLARNGVQLVLHGHFHWADLVGLTYWNTESNNSKVETIVVSAGSATAVDVDDHHNSCNYINLGQFRTSIKRPHLDHGEYQKLAAAESFEFVHKPKLSFEDGNLQDVPVFLDVLVTGLAAQEKYADQKHLYGSVKSTGFIDDDRNYFGSVELEGTNPTKQATNYLPFVFSAVGTQNFVESDCRAIDLKSGKELQAPVLVEERPISVFPCRIFFNQPLVPNDSFKIRVHFRLQKVMLEQKDYDMLSLFRFPRGLACAEIALISSKTLVGPVLWELRGGKLKPSNISLDFIQKVPENPAGKAAVDGYSAAINSPSALSYLLQYEKLA